MGKPQHGACGHAEVRHPRKSWRREPAPEGVSGLGLEGDVSGPSCGSTPLACRHLAMLSHSHVVIQPRSLNSMEGKRPTTQGFMPALLPWGTQDLGQLVELVARALAGRMLGQGEGWQEGPLCLLFSFFFFFFCQEEFFREAIGLGLSLSRASSGWEGSQEVLRGWGRRCRSPASASFCISPRGKWSQSPLAFLPTHPLTHSLPGFRQQEHMCLLLPQPCKVPAHLLSCSCLS